MALTNILNEMTDGQFAPTPAGLTPGQVAAQQYLQTIQGRNATDYTGATRQDTIWGDQQLQEMLQGSEGSYDPSVINKVLAQNTATYDTQGAGALGQQNYNKYLEYANNNVDWWNEHPNGIENGMDWFMENVFPAVVLTMVGGQAGGLFGGTGAEAGAGAAGLAGGEAGAAGAGLGAAGAGEAGLAGAGAVGAGEAGVGLGGTAVGAGVGAGGIPSVTITGAAGGAGGAGLGGALAGAGAVAGLGGLIGGGGGTPPSSNPPAPNVDPNDPTIPQVQVPGTAPGQPPYLPPVGAGAFPPLPIPSFPVPDVNGPPGSTPPAGGIPQIPSGVGQFLNGLGGLLGGNVDRIKAQQDADWWKSQIDTLQGMYKPGTPEADLMEQKMRAKDAMAGRNSQYGVRAVDLASNLADKRSNIMTSAGYQNMANAYRNRSSQDLNGLFSAMGGMGGLGNMLSTGINGINSIAGLFSGSGGTTPPPTVNVAPPVR